jgi:hypothetical protein
MKKWLTVAGELLHGFGQTDLSEEMIAKSENFLVQVAGGVFETCDQLRFYQFHKKTILTLKK